MFSYWLLRILTTRGAQIRYKIDSEARDSPWYAPPLSKALSRKIAHLALDCYFTFHNNRRPHSGLEECTPQQAYFELAPALLAA
jgi:hypothetical protein